MPPPRSLIWTSAQSPDLMLTVTVALHLEDTAHPAWSRAPVIQALLQLKMELQGILLLPHIHQQVLTTNRYVLLTPHTSLPLNSIFTMDLSFIALQPSYDNRNGVGLGSPNEHSPRRGMNGPPEAKYGFSPSSPHDAISPSSGAPQSSLYPPHQHNAHSHMHGHSHSRNTNMARSPLAHSPPLQVSMCSNNQCSFNSVSSLTSSCCELLK